MRKNITLKQWSFFMLVKRKMKWYILIYFYLMIWDQFMLLRNIKHFVFSKRQLPLLTVTVIILWFNELYWEYFWLIMEHTMACVFRWAICGFLTVKGWKLLKFYKFMKSKWTIRENMSLKKQSSDMKLTSQLLWEMTHSHRVEGGIHVCIQLSR